MHGGDSAAERDEAKKKGEKRRERTIKRLGFTARGNCFSFFLLEMELVQNLEWDTKIQASHKYYSPAFLSISFIFVLIYLTRPTEAGIGSS